MKKKKYIFVVALLIGILAVTGISYAVWQLTKTQEGTNTLNSSCFKITFKDQDDITLQDAYPMSDEEGMELPPYTFTITNVCETYASYQINLEVLNNTTFTDLTIMNISLNEKEAKGYSTYDVTEKTLENASFSRKLENGYLYPLEEKTFTLRLWMDEDTPTEDAYMNQSFQSKVTIVTSYLKESPTYAEVITNCSKNGYQTTECMLENSKYDRESLAYDETVDNNLRYIGSNPNNYVLFNNELWRIIGVMNNVEDGNGNIDSRVKLIRDESIGEYSWDTSPSNINSGQGVNEWSQADLMKLMNPGYESESIGGSLYWNRQSGKCYNRENNSNTSCDFTSSGLSEEAKSHISEALWYTGSNGVEISYENVTTIKFYELERSNNIGKICTSGSQCNDTVERTTSWKGLVGLMSPADYGYATSGSNKINRETCLNTILFSWNGSEVTECKNNNWLYSESNTQWTIMPGARQTYAGAVFRVSSAGSVYGGSNAYLSYHVYPVVYLNSNTKIISGDGTIENSYKLSIE